MYVAQPPNSSGNKDNIGEIWWVRVCMCQLATVIFSNMVQLLTSSSSKLPR